MNEAHIDCLYFMYMCVGMETGPIVILINNTGIAHVQD